MNEIFGLRATINGKRTTISVERTLNDLACTHFGQDPNEKDAIF